MIELHYEEESWQIEESDESYRFQELMGDDNVTLVFSLPYWQEFQVGTWIEFLGSKYTLAQPPTFTKNSERNYKYTLIFESEACKLQNFKMRDVVQGDMRLKFSLCAKPHEFIDAIVTNLNARDSGWERGECIEGTEKTIAFSHNTLAEALQMVADEFETEWEIKNKTICLRKVEYCKDDPLKLSYGRGNGFISGVGRDNQDEGKPIEILYVQGGEQNIDRSKYGWQYLLLPKGQTIEYEGRTYIASEDGLSMKRADKEVKYGNEDSLDCEEIYPKRVGTVSSVKEVDGKDSEGNAEKWYNITDKDNTIDYNQYIIEGETGTLIFQSGMLASREFEWQYNHEEKTITENGVKYTLPAHTFRLVNFEEDGITFPSGNYIPKVGDTYAIFNINLPQEYIDSAEQEMFLEGAKYLYEHESFAFTFIGVLQGKWAKDNWSTGQRVSTHLAIGSYVHFFDSQFAPEGTDLRIISIKQYLYDPYSPTVEISNESSGSSFSSELKKLANEEVLRDDADKQLMRYSKRRFRDAKETMQMIEQALLKNFTESISPITVQTMSMLVGDESLQFRFVSVNTDDDGKVTSDPIIDSLFFITWDNKTQTLQSSQASILQHMTVGITAVSNSHATTEYYFWNIAKLESIQLTEGDKKYYLYAQCPTEGIKQGYVKAGGVLMLSETAIEEKGVEGYYHFLVGILNSEYDGERSYVSLYGYSEVLPGRITTDLIQDSEGNLVIDLLNATITARNGGKLKGVFEVTGANDSTPVSDLTSIDIGDVTEGNINTVENDLYYPGGSITPISQDDEYLASMWDTTGTRSGSSVVPCRWAGNNGSSLAHDWYMLPQANAVELQGKTFVVKMQITVLKNYYSKASVWTGRETYDESGAETFTEEYMYFFIKWTSSSAGTSGITKYYFDMSEDDSGNVVMPSEWFTFELPYTSAIPSDAKVSCGFRIYTDSHKFHSSGAYFHFGFIGNMWLKENSAIDSNGGLVSSLYVLLDSAKNVIGGMSGLSNKVAMWEGGTYSDAYLHPEKLPFFISKTENGSGSKFGLLEIEDNQTVQIETSFNKISLTTKTLNDTLSKVNTWATTAGDIFTYEMHDTHNGGYLSDVQYLYPIYFARNTYYVSGNGMQLKLKVYAKKDGISERFLLRGYFVVFIEMYDAQTGNFYLIEVKHGDIHGSTSATMDGTKYTDWFEYEGTTVGKEHTIVNIPSFGPNSQTGGAIMVQINFSGMYYANGPYRSKMWADFILHNDGISGVGQTAIENQIAICQDGIGLQNGSGVQFIMKNDGSTFYLKGSGLPLSADGLDVGQVYVDNGYLKVKTTALSSSVASEEDSAEETTESASTEESTSTTTDTTTNTTVKETLKEDTLSADEITDSGSVDDTTTDPTE